MIGPDIPRAGVYLFGWFEALSARRSGGVSGVEPITNLEIVAWASLRKISLRPWEADVLCDLDDVFCATMNSTHSDEEDERDNAE